MAGIYALIVAGGQGLRFDSTLAKQYWPIDGHALLRHTVKAFVCHPSVAGVQVVIHPDHQHLYDEAVKGLSLLPAVIGASHRQGSVYKGLIALKAYDPDMVLIHDGARPFLSSKLIDSVIEGVKCHRACIPVVPVMDTLKVCEQGWVHRTTTRDGLYGAQTPQGFDFTLIFEVHDRLKDQTHFTDDASMLESLDIPVASCLGEVDNFKITTLEDYHRGKRMSLDIRVGNGFDVHGFTEGTGLWICGVFIPFTKSLKGHSDADVALHAIVDALLGAIGAEDIGHHFPPSDPHWRGASSDQFVHHALKLVAQKGGRLNHVDVTIVGEEPKLSPYRALMVKRLSEILCLDEQKVSVKATTTERLGFVGRKEGLAATATATVIIEGGR